MALDESRCLQMRFSGENRRVEALQMSHLEHTPFRFRELDELARFLRRFRNRLLDQHMHAGFEEIPRDREVRWRGGDDADRVHASRSAHGDLRVRLGGKLAGHYLLAGLCARPRLPTRSQSVAPAYFCAWNRPR